MPSLIDKYVLKREFARDYKETGKWSLQRLEKYSDSKKKGDKPKYVGTLGDESNDNVKNSSIMFAYYLYITKNYALDYGNFI